VKPSPLVPLAPLRTCVANIEVRVFRLVLDAAGKARVVHVAAAALDETAQQVLVLWSPAAVELVLREPLSGGPRDFLRDDGRDFAAQLSALRVYDVLAGVRRLVDEVSDGGVAPGVAVLAWLATVLAPRRRDTLGVEPRRLAVERAAGGDVREYLPDPRGLFLDHDEHARFRYVVSVGNHPEALAVFERAAHSLPHALGNGLPLELREAGEHLEDEPARRRRGVYGLRRGAHGDPGLLEPVVGIHDHDELAPDPIQLVEEHRVEVAPLGIFEHLEARRPPSPNGLEKNHSFGGCACY
jgi:hypothetical protein